MPHRLQGISGRSLSTLRCGKKLCLLVLHQRWLIRRFHILIQVWASSQALSSLDALELICPTGTAALQVPISDVLSYKRILNSDGTPVSIFLGQIPCVLSFMRARGEVSVAKMAVYGAIHALAARVPKTVQDREELTHSIALPSTPTLRKKYKGHCREE